MTGWRRVSIITAGVVLVAAAVLAYMYWPRPTPGFRELKITFTYQPSTHQIAAFIILHEHWIEEEARKLGRRLATQ